ncbi:MAG: class I SAM-dependent methyltransferase [Hyphomicrobiales bacterium]|nr:MAG: class I SAM-dependent methyltransferase [Hyphomicrobiales bacterium]
MMKFPTAFTEAPQCLQCCNAATTAAELKAALAVRREYVLPGMPMPYMEDVVRAFRVAQGAAVYIEIGTQDRGNIAWLAREKLARNATIIDIDYGVYSDSERRLATELKAQGFDYHLVRGDCLSDPVQEAVHSILNGRVADLIFCDSHYTYEHTISEFALYRPLVRSGGYLLFHDAQWPGRMDAKGEEAKKGKGYAILELDRFYPAWMVVGPDTPLHRPLPTSSWEGHWGTLAVFPC